MLQLFGCFRQWKIGSVLSLLINCYGILAAPIVLGCGNWLRAFIIDYGILAAPIHKLVSEAIATRLDLLLLRYEVS